MRWFVGEVFRDKLVDLNTRKHSFFVFFPMFHPAMILNSGFPTDIPLIIYLKVRNDFPFTMLVVLSIFKVLSGYI